MTTAITSPAIGAARVLVAHHGQRVRSGVRSLAAGGTGVVVAGEAATAREAVAACRALCPDIVLVDLGLPGVDADPAVIRQLTAGGTVAVLLQADPDDPRVVGALRCGVAGLVHRDAPIAEVVRALQLLAHGVAPLFLRPVSRPPTVHREVPVITPNVVELTRGCAHSRRLKSMPAATPAAAGKA
jgi:DNA-binding NarL/FixJ family response regulator